MEHTLALIEKAHEGDKAARDQLVMDNVGLIWSIVRRFSGRGYEMEDLFQIGSIGLIKAIDKFDTGFDVKFSTYAVPMITGEIKRFLRDDGMIKVSRSIKEMGIRVRAAREEMTYSLGREPTIEEIARHLDTSREEVAASLEAGAEVESLYRPAGNGDDNTTFLMDRLEEENNDHEELLNRMVLKELMEGLNEEQREIIVRRYFYNQTQTQIAKELGISQVQVSRLEKRILKEMRGSVNRKVNCETANINKTVSAAIRQIEDIRYIDETTGFSSLPEPLEQMARLRLQCPEASLLELGKMLTPVVGKSGVNHRLRKLKEIAEDLRRKQGGEVL